MADFANLWKAIKTTGWATPLLDTPLLDTQTFRNFFQMLSPNFFSMSK